MATLLNSLSEKHVYLKPVHIIGRDYSADTFIEHALCSRVHCVLRFQDGFWLVTDESKNGTFLNNKRLGRGKSVKIRVGDVLSFPVNKSESLTLLDDSKPKPVLLNTDSDQIIELDTLNLLPNENAAEIVLTQQNNGWLVEKGANSYPVNSGEKLTIAGQQWVFFANDMMLATVTQIQQEISCQDIQLRFEISLNEETVKLIVHYFDHEEDFGYKAHHYLLVQLARQRLLDKERDVSHKDHGWLATEVLFQEMKIDDNLLNIQIYRARKAFNKLGFPHSFIERRQGEIRLCNCNLLLLKGEVEQHYQSPV